MPLVFVRPFAYSLAHLEAARKVGATGFSAPYHPRECLVDNAAAHLLQLLEPECPCHAPSRVAKANRCPCPRGCSPRLTDLNLIASAPHLLPRLEMPDGHQVVGQVYAN